MCRSICVLIMGLTLLSISDGSYQKTKKSKLNHPPVVEQFETTRRILSFCPWSIEGGECNRPDTRLSVIASDSDGDKLNYRYESTVGKILGKGSEVTWILESGSPRGDQTATVIVDDGRGGEVHASLHILIIDCGVCDPPPPPCPQIAVLCPEHVESSKTLRFKATIISKQESQRPSFKWTVRWGVIVSGQFTDEIEVQPSDPDEELTATVEVGGYDPSCATAASCTVNIKQQ
ncbi:MAG TPA: hypothetical protein VGP85_20690 [Pyrinomonadaceae bacterium]|jgi:hypothetical protein|nr:hypothetical protein [Pyrinomonadaceae bacterium]